MGLKTAFKIGLLSQLLPPLGALAAYSPIREYSGQNFFNRFTFFDKTDAGINNGDVQFLGQADAMSQNLTSINSAGNAVIRVSTDKVDFPNKRNSIRLEGTETYGIGSLIVIDVVHMPFGCSVWPAFWTRTTGLWPDGGEIDIIEGVNRRTFNQMALHTSPGCSQADAVVQGGTTTSKDCNMQSGAVGCIVQEKKAASYGTAFNDAGGGVFAAQIDVSGIFVWFFGRNDIPPDIKSATSTSSLDTSTWGTPSAAWPASSCKIEDHFQPQQLVLDITLCGDFATAVYNQTCTPYKQSCYVDNVINDGSNYADAFFEIPYIRVYNANPSAVPSSISSGTMPSSTLSGSSTPTSGSSSNTGNNSGGNSGNTNAASRLPLTHGGFSIALLASIGYISTWNLL